LALRAKAEQFPAQEKSKKERKSGFQPGAGLLEWKKRGRRTKLPVHREFVPAIKRHVYVPPSQKMARGGFGLGWGGKEKGQGLTAVRVGKIEEKSPLQVLSAEQRRRAKRFLIDLG